MNNHLAVVILFGYLSLQGCTATSPPMAEPAPTSAAPELVYGTYETSPTIEPVVAPTEGGTEGNITDYTRVLPINLTPLSDYSDDWRNSSPSGGDFSDAYTRIIIYGGAAAQGKSVAEGEVVNLGYNSRNFLARALVGSDFSINLTTHIKVGSYETTVPLVTIGHESNSDGEQWNRAIYYDRLNFPLFLVKADGGASIPIVKFEVKGSKSYASRGAAAAVQVALGVANATVLPVSVVTKLSEQSTKDQARAIDDAISKLFSTGLTEQHWTDRDLRYWNVQASDSNKPNGVKVAFSIPKNESDWNSQTMPVGTWTVTFDHPRPSIFSDWRICAKEDLNFRCAKDKDSAKNKVRSDINPGQVLNYELVTGNNGIGTIRAFLTQKDWYIDALNKLSSSKKFDDAKPIAESFCRQVINEITSIGLNGFDAGIVVWAVFNGMPLPTLPENIPGNVPGCNSYKEIETQRT